VKRVLIALFCTSTSLYGSAILVTNPAGVFGSDFVNWSQPGTYVASTYNWMSSDYSEFVTSRLSNGSGQTVPACSTCAFKPSGGIAAGDTLLLNSQGSNDSFTLSSPVYGAGAYIEAANAGNVEANSTFTVEIQAFYGVSSVLTSTALVTSDSAGDPIFIGVTDPSAEINRIVFSLTDANGNPIAENFAIDKLYLDQTAPVVTQPTQTVQTFQPVQIFQPVQPLLLGSDPPSVPEPSMMFLVGPAILGLVFKIRRRAARG
jgi:hypothetical protein